MTGSPRAPRTLLPFVALLTATALVAACGGGASPTPSPVPTDAPPPATPDAAAPALEGTRWLLVEGSLPGLPAGTVVDAVFEAGRVAGQGPCNRYFADVTVAGEKLTVGPVGATKMSCGPELDRAEQAYFGALGRTAAQAVEGSTLTLRDGSGADLLVFEAGAAAAPTGLPGTSWRVTRYAGDAGALVAPLPNTEVSLQLGADGRLGGTAGCNQLGADATIDEAAGTVTFGLFTMTMMMCEPPALMAQETGLVAALEKTASYTIADGKLTLRDAAGKAVVEAEAAAPGA